MFFPIRDDNPTRTAPWLTLILIGVNVAVHLLSTLALGRGEFWFHAWYGLVPTRLLSDPVGESQTLLTSMFVHGSWLHLGSNMWFLHIFGDNLEDVLGRVRYVAFYLACGLVAAAFQIFVDVDSMVPMVGASGAIAGIVSGYVLVYPRAPILCLSLVPPLWLLVGVLPVLPAWVVALMFFLQNLVMGYQSLGGADVSVAFFAHIGGFVGGLVFLKLALGKRVITTREWGGWEQARSRRFRR
jgi:membrane associated rhomboid family serine protease